ncbi:MAG: hypothetical protein ACKOYG_09785 [Ilumatobacteraceae bacterium]
MLSAVVHLQGSTVVLDLLPLAETGEAGEEIDPGPGPIVPEAKELYWGAGSFIVFALLMRFFLYPRLKKGMDARYHSIRGAHEAADAERAAARAEVADYEAQVASIKAEAARTVEAARATLEGERAAKLAEANARIAEKRAASNAQAEAARAAVRDQIAAAVGDVAGRAGELATGKAPSAAVVAKVVSEVMAR